jgi:hypothetical protein
VNEPLHPTVEGVEARKHRWALQAQTDIDYLLARLREVEAARDSALKLATQETDWRRELQARVAELEAAIYEHTAYCTDQPEDLRAAVEKKAL